MISDGKNISRTVIGHLIEDCNIVRIYAREEKISGTFWLDRKEDPRCDTSFDLGNATIIMHGAFHRGMQFCVKADLKLRGGKIIPVGENKLRVEDALEILAFINIGTDVNGETPLE